MNCIINKLNKPGISSLLHVNDMYINLGIHLGILITALNIAYSTHVVNIVRFIKVDNYTVVFWPSKKVLWRNRHHLHYMSRNRLMNMSRSELYGTCVREKEYEGNEPPEEDDVSSSAELNSVTFTMGLG